MRAAPQPCDAAAFLVDRHERPRAGFSSIAAQTASTSARVFKRDGLEFPREQHDAARAEFGQFAQRCVLGGGSVEADAQDARREPLEFRHPTAYAKGPAVSLDVAAR